jgi:hypothetical protein
MRVLLDECVPRKFRNFLPDYDCHTVPEQGLAGKKNGELLSLAEKSGFQVFLTLDRGLEYEQNLQQRPIAVIANQAVWRISRRIALKFCECFGLSSPANL